MRISRCRTGIFQMREKIKKMRFCEKFAFATLATRVAARHASKPVQNVPRAWKLSWRCNWLHALLPMQNKNFPNARKNQENEILRKIRVCNACNESCCAARIKSCSKRATSVEIELALQLVACASPDAEQEFSKCEKKSRK